MQKACEKHAFFVIKFVFSYCFFSVLLFILT